MRTVIETEEHADSWRVRLEGDTLPLLFAAVAEYVAGTNPCAAGVGGEWEHIRLAAPHPSDLLTLWVNELVEKSSADTKSYAEQRDVRIVIGRDGRAELEAWIRGAPVSSWSSPISGAASAIVTRVEDHWRATLLFAL